MNDPVGRMPRHKLRELVRRLRHILFYDDIAGEWDADKPWDADTLQDIGQLMDDFGLRPAASDDLEDP